MTTEQWERFYDQLSAALAAADSVPRNAAEGYLADVAAHAESRLRGPGQYTLPAAPDPLRCLAEIGLETVASFGPFTDPAVLETVIESVVLEQITHELESPQLEELARLYPAELADRQPRYLPDGEETGVDLYERNLRELLEERILLLIAGRTLAAAIERRQNDR
jgi:hypothetical protein